MIVSLVLAAGRSSRMGSPKALLRDANGAPFVVRIVRTLRAAGLLEISVVTSASLHDEVRAALGDAAEGDTRVVVNQAPDRGQVTSLWAGMDAAPLADASGLLLTLVDVPLVTTATVRTVVDAYAARGPALIVRPAIGDRHGHPVVFAPALFNELRTVDPALGAKAVLRRHASDVHDVPVDDRGAIIDIDTPEEYREAVR